MGKNTKIEWCDHTWNPWRGCSKVSAGCANCYAETLSHRNPAVLGVWGDDGTRVVASESMWRQPLRWNAQAAHQVAMAQKYGWEIPPRPRVFCASLADVFEDRPELEEPRERLFNLIYETKNLDWLLLTKRPDFANRWIGGLSGAGLAEFPSLYPNVWFGTSVENQQTADERIPHLLRCPAAVHFLSIEPLLGPVDLLRHLNRRIQGELRTELQSISWVIVGGESGPRARPMDPAWARSLRDQCQAAGVPFFFKQGSAANWTNFKDFDSFPEDLRIREMPEA